MNNTIEWWQKIGNSENWENKVFTIGRRAGKSTYVQMYINEILQEQQMRVLNKKHWPHQFKMDSKRDIAEMERWCYNNLKSANWRNYGTFFAFKNQADASYFLLFWS